MTNTININTANVSDLIFLDAVNAQRLIFTDSNNEVKLGDHVYYSINGNGGQRVFEGIAISLQRSDTYGTSRRFICRNYAQLASDLKLKYTSDSDSYDSAFSASSLGSSYKIRLKGSGITGEMSFEKMLHKINLAMNDPAIRLTGKGIVIMHEGLPAKSNIEWLIGGSFKTFFSNVIKRAYPTSEIRFDRNYIYIFDRLKSPVHKLANKDIGYPALSLSLLNSYSKVVVESKDVDEANSTAFPVTGATEQIPVPPFANNDYHYSDLEQLTTTDLNDSGLNTDHDAYTVAVTANGNIQISGGQDTRLEVQSTKKAICKQRYGWDRDAVIIDDDLGKVQNAGANNIDYTDIMQDIADRQIDNLERPVIAGKLAMQYCATEIFPGQQVNLYEDNDFAPYNLYVSSVTFAQNGSCYLMISPPGSTNIESSKIDFDLEENRKNFNAQRKVQK